MSAGPRKSRFNLQTEKTKMSKLETNTKGPIGRTFRLTILHFQLESLFLRVGCHGGFKVHENNNKKLSHISIVDYISFDADICSRGLERT